MIVKPKGTVGVPTVSGAVPVFFTVKVRVGGVEFWSTVPK